VPSGGKNFRRTYPNNFVSRRSRLARRSVGKFEHPGVPNSIGARILSPPPSPPPSLSLSLSLCIFLQLELLIAASLLRQIPSLTSHRMFCQKNIISGGKLDARSRASRPPPPPPARPPAPVPHKCESRESGTRRGSPFGETQFSLYITCGVYVAPPCLPPPSALFFRVPASDLESDSPFAAYVSARADR